MRKSVLVAGVLGWIVLGLWMFLSNGVLGLRSRTDMMRVPDERRVYEVLKESIVEPGGYTCNPPLTPDGVFPPGEPVFGIRYGGSGHEIAGRMLVVHLATGLIATTLVAWMLSVTSARIVSVYPRKVLFCAFIGLLFALLGDLPSYGIGGYPLRSALLLGGQNLVAWTLAGLVMAWRIRPDPGSAAPG